jgi:TonB family protein
MNPITKYGIVGVIVVALAGEAPSTTSRGRGPVHIVGMRYPASARNARIQGVVRIRCLLNPDGSVQGVTIVSGHPILTAAVLENARQWRFGIRETLTGSEQAGLLTYEFKLTDPVCTGEYQEQFTFDEPNSVLVTSQFPCWRPDSGEK